MSKLLSDDNILRLAAPSQVLDWNTPESWLINVPALLPEVITVDLKRHYLSAPPESPYSDNLSWLEERHYSVTRNKIELIPLMIGRLREKYKAKRTCHSTRLEDVNSFYERGIIPLSIEESHKRLRSLFMGDRFPDITEEKFQNAVDDVGSKLRQGRIYFDANEAAHIKEFGHYLLYGSEYLLSIAIRLGPDWKMRKYLREIGQPTLFICDVPLPLISDAWIKEYAGSMLSIYFLELQEKGAGVTDGFEGGAAISIHEKLEPSSIVGHYHPSRVYDPLERRWWHSESEN